MQLMQNPCKSAAQWGIQHECLVALCAPSMLFEVSCIDAV
ncbi:hypothetical protein FBY30_3472 [Arthrobacter sp. SLBN-83]|nr:hypothetical protein FBY30_3472 [Arthrobacter sp. SLBN-83]